MYTPKHLRRWKRPNSYIGAEWPDYFPFLGRSRDSDLVEESNFRVGLERLGGESDTVIVTRCSHWAVGWVEKILIHESDEAALRAADQMTAKIMGYPILDEEDYSRLELDRACDYWEAMSTRERVWWCQKYGVSVFAARRSEIPEDRTGELMSALAE